MRVKTVLSEAKVIATAAVHTTRLEIQIPEVGGDSYISFVFHDANVTQRATMDELARRWNAGGPVPTSKG